LSGISPRAGDPSPVESEVDPVTPGPDDSTWDRAEWLTGVREIPPGATWPRVMSAPHPLAVGSYGLDLVGWSRARGVELRWWQVLAAIRLLEHDAAGALVWPWWLASTSRQVGKSWLLRELLLWRIHQAERFGEPQLVLHTGKDLPVCREVQRPARAWAHRQPGYVVREANGLEEIETPDGSRWLVRGRGSVYGYSSSLAVVDEAWKVAPDVVDDGIEPTMAERSSPQLGLVSTAHRLATGLVPERRRAAIEQLVEPRDTLLIEWSASPSLDIGDEAGWRQASPQWTAGRQRLVEAQYRRAREGGRSEDPDEPDPIESFRSQWLNAWPVRRGLVDTRAGEPLLPDGGWAERADLGATAVGSLVLAVEDWFGNGAAAAALGRTADGRLLTWGTIVDRRADAFTWAAALAETHPRSRLIVGASLDADPDVLRVPVAARETAGQAQTRLGMPLLRELVATRALVHDGGRDLAEQVDRCRLVESRAGGLSVHVTSGRTDLLRCVVWALLSDSRQAATPPRPRFVVR
jgi:hypothetical protein